MAYARELPNVTITDNHETRLVSLKSIIDDHEARLVLLEAIAESGEQVDWSGVIRMASETTQTQNPSGETMYVFPQGTEMGGLSWGALTMPSDGYIYFTVNYSCSVRDGNSWLRMDPNVNGVVVGYVGTGNDYDTDATNRNRSFVQAGPIRVNSGDVVNFYGGDAGSTVWTAYNGNAYFIPIVRNKLSGDSGGSIVIAETKPDYSAIESVNLISEAEGTWTADRNGYVYCWAAMPAETTVRFSVNDVIITRSGSVVVTNFGALLEVSKGDIVKISTDNELTSCTCNFIPQKTILTSNTNTNNNTNALAAVPQQTAVPLRQTAPLQQNPKLTTSFIQNPINSIFKGGA